MANLTDKMRIIQMHLPGKSNRESTQLQMAFGAEQ